MTELWLSVKQKNEYYIINDCFGLYLYLRSFAVPFTKNGHLLDFCLPLLPFCSSYSKNFGQTVAPSQMWNVRCHKKQKGNSSFIDLTHSAKFDALCSFSNSIGTSVSESSIPKNNISWSTIVFPKSVWTDICNDSQCHRQWVHFHLFLFVNFLTSIEKCNRVALKQSKAETAKMSEKRQKL